MKLILFPALLIALSSFTTPCKGIKKDGTNCRSTIVSKKTGFCNAHNPDKKTCPHVKKDGTNCQMPTNGKLCRHHSAN
jgi:hypothetical protein